MKPRDIPELPFSKPKELVFLQELAPEQRDAMDPWEQKHRVQKFAYELSEAFLQHDPKLDYEGCLTFVGNALMETGGAFGGQFGMLMVGEAETIAMEACDQLYPAKNPRDWN